MQISRIFKLLRVKLDTFDVINLHLNEIITFWATNLAPYNYPFKRYIQNGGVKNQNPMHARSKPMEL